MVKKLGSVLFISFFLTAGCNTIETKEESKTYEVVEKDPVIVTHNLEGGMEALVEGTLFYDSDTKCLFLESGTEDDLEKMKFPVWPNGTTAYTEDGLKGVKIPNYGTVLEGDFISGSGGGIDKSDLKGIDELKECVENNSIYVISEIEK